MFFITQNPDVSDKSQYFRYNKKVEYMRLSFSYTTAKQMKRTKSHPEILNLNKLKLWKKKNDNTKSERKGHS